VAVSHLKPSKSTIALVKHLKLSPLKLKGTWGKVIVMLLSDPHVYDLRCRCGERWNVDAQLLVAAINAQAVEVKVPPSTN